MSKEKMNCVCIVDCCLDVEQSIVTRLIAGITYKRMRLFFTMITELTGRTTGDCNNDDDGDCVKWTIDNKYYKTEVYLKVMQESVASRVKDTSWQALIIICDPSQSLSIKTAYSKWEEFRAEATPPINLLVGVVNGCGLVEDVRSEMLKWCLERGVELVIWDTSSKSQTFDEDDDFPESVGVVRISEALQAHMWPHMTLKSTSDRHGEGEDSREQTSSVCLDDEVGDERESEPRVVNESKSCSETSSTGLSSTATKSASTDVADSNSGINITTTNTSTTQQCRLDSLLATTTTSVLERPDNEGGDREEGEEDGVDDFETLFAKFADMKAHAQSLPHEERKAYAEKVVMSFWNAIGGDENEVNSDSDTEHDNN